jgi:hypothetical protein
MNLITIIAVLLTSLLFTTVFVAVLKCRGPWGSGWTFFTIVCLWLAAVSLWVPPAAPVWFGAPWIDLMLTGLLVSFVLSATSIDPSTASGVFETGSGSVAEEQTNPTGSIRANSEVNAKPAETSNDSVHLNGTHGHPHITFRSGGVFWMLLVCLCALIIIGAS